MDYIRMMEEARNRNANRDALDYELGFAAPGDVSPDMQLATAMEAIKAGIKLNEWEFVAEAQAMLEVLLAQLQGAK